MAIDYLSEVWLVHSVVGPWSPRGEDDHYTAAGGIEIGRLNM